MPSLAVIRNLSDIENSSESFSISGEGIEKCQSLEKSGGALRALGAKKSISQEAGPKSSLPPQTESECEL
jgi:hypothetical protein